jgi:hypothetical protein
LRAAYLDGRQGSVKSPVEFGRPLALRPKAAISAAMAWLRSPIFYGIVLLCAGALLRAMLAVPETPQPLTPETLRRALEFQQKERPLLALEPRYRPFAFAFLLASSAAEMQSIKRAIDAELATAEEVRERGLSGVPEYAAEALVAPDIVLMALGAALVLRSLAFVLAIGFAIGGFHQLMLQSGKLTPAPGEFYLAAILAALVWAALFWALRAFHEGRLRFRT